MHLFIKASTLYVKHFAISVFFQGGEAIGLEPSSNADHNKKSTLSGMGIAPYICKSLHAQFH